MCPVWCSVVWCVGFYERRRIEVPLRVTDVESHAHSYKLEIGGQFYGRFEDVHENIDGEVAFVGRVGLGAGSSVELLSPRCLLDGVQTAQVQASLPPIRNSSLIAAHRAHQTITDGHRIACRAATTIKFIRMRRGASSRSDVTLRLAILFRVLQWQPTNHK